MATPSEIVKNLNVLDIPAKLRCAACNKLANNAFRIQCCDQSICEDCQSSLPQACPICLHEPVKPDDCRPNKALRTTVRVWLKKKGMEIEAAKKKEMIEKAAAATPVTLDVKPTLPPQQVGTTLPPDAPVKGSEAPPEVARSRSISQVLKPTDEANPVADEVGTPKDAQQDVPQLSIESPGPQGTPRRASTQTAGDASVGQEKTDEKEQTSNLEQPQTQNAQWAMSNGLGIGMNGAGVGFDGMNGAFPNMGMNGMGDFNQMMQFMPNGMPNNMMAMVPNMTGMPGMGVDPMAMSQGMYGGFGNMGMNGMNMGMGFDAGQGAYGGFNGQSSAWNAGPNKFIQNSYGGHANGMGGNNYGPNAGYAGYNMPPHQGNFNQMHQHHYPNNDFQHGYHNQGFQARGRGRGRGGYSNAGRGRGGHAQFAQGNHTNNEAFHQQAPQGPVRRGSPQYTPMTDQPSQQQISETGQKPEVEEILSKSAEDQLNKELAPGDAEDDDEKPSIEIGMPKDEESNAVDEVTDVEANAIETKPLEQIEEVDTGKTLPSPPAEDPKPAPIETFISDDMPKSEKPLVETIAAAPSAMLPPPSPIIPTGPSHSMNSSPRGRGRRFHTRGFTDHRGISQGRGAGYLPNGSQLHDASVPTVDIPLIAPVAPKGLGVEGAPTGPKALRQGFPNTGIRENKGFSIAGRASVAAQSSSNGDLKQKSPVRTRSQSRSRSRSRSRSPIRHHSSHHRHYRHRSISPKDEEEKKTDRHRHHSRKYDDEKEDRGRDHRLSRPRDVSVDSSIKKSLHRSHRERDDYDREKEKEKDSARSSHRSRRTYRERSREPEIHRSKKRSRSGSPRRSRSRSPELEFHINGASRMNSAKLAKINSVPKDDQRIPSSRKRRDRDEDDHHRERKRSRREEEIVGEYETSQSKHSKREGKESRPNHDRGSKALEKPKSPPKGPKLDQHAIEREARNRERQMKELQRRAVMEGKGTRKGNAGTGSGARRVSVKYEDDETIGRVENEREAGRWG